MSSKSARRSKAPPREQSVLNAEYSQLCSKVGQASYQMEIIKRDIANFMFELREINREAAERKALDDAKPKAETQTTTEVKSNE